MIPIKYLVPAFPDPVFYFIPGFIILILAELFINYKQNLHLFERSDSIACIGMGIGSLFIDLVMKTLAYLAYNFIFTHYAIFKIGWQWWAWLLILFADDLTFYIHHRLSHTVRILWAAHVNHHSSEQYNLAVALRQSWTELFYKYIWWLWLPLVGFQPIMILIMMSLSLIYQFWVHTKTIGKLGFIELFMNTPSHHRVHHASNIRYLDRNHAGIFIIWDKLFGTFAEETETPVYGLTTNIKTYNIFEIAIHEFRAIWNDTKRPLPFITSLKYVFMPPGWSHDGSTKTANELRREL